ncbi:MAG: FtsX-like permease family protein [Eubacterium sp.]|jgi:putative ABC transport system permease protein|nr:FtsX-like permease family protein [Eubacterium sp.]
MKNPLMKRLPRELKDDFVKYLVLFMFMTLTIGFISGFLVAGGSLKTAYDESFEKYSIESGHFLLKNEADNALIKKIEKEKVTVYKNYYMDIDTDSNLDGKTNSTLRIFKNRERINKVCIMEGKLPVSDKEIAVDRMYADNNHISVGDSIKAGEKRLEVTGLVALSDYSAMFSNNTDLMFDAVLFGVAVVSDDLFKNYNHNINYCYSWLYDMVPQSDEEEKKVSDAFLKTLYKNVYMSGNEIEAYVPRYQNSAINFTGNDIGGDQGMMLILLYILIALLAFVFAVTINHTIVRESAVIGTLRAMGYSKIELVRHYLMSPILVSVASAVIGNVLGYTVFKSMVVSLYYESYSLPTYETIWNGNAFVLTTVIPMAIILVINLYSLTNKMSLSPLKFIRKDFNKSKKKKAFRLNSKIKFITRFRIRIIFQNKSSYITLFIGIVFANIILLFGMMLPPLLKHYQDSIIDNMIARYQYVLKKPVEVKAKDAEKYAMTVLQMNKESISEQVSIYGIEENSRYIKDTPIDGYYISSSMSEKYKIERGETIVLKEKYNDKQYQFKVKGIINYPGSLAVFMNKNEFCKVFNQEQNYYTGYFSDTKLNIVEKNIASVITEEDLTKTSRQLNVSMGNMFYLVEGFAIVLFVMLIYLLTKLIIEKNTNAISMVKILGYNDKEIGRLYIIATTWVVLISVFFSLFIASGLIHVIYFEMMKGYSGWLTLYIAPSIYIQMFMIGIGCYVLMLFIQFRKIKKIPMGAVLKNVE